MAKRTRQVDEVTAAVRREPQDEDVYWVGEWNGVAHYVCRLCPFDTLTASNMLEHLGCHAQQFESEDVGDGDSGKE